MVTQQEKRRHNRSVLHGHIADIADGKFVYGGIIEDISMSGMKLSNLPSRFAVEGRTYRIVVSGGSPPCHIKLTVRPRWKRTAVSGLSMDIGFRVVEAPWEWTELVHSVLPEEEKEQDVWDQFSS